MRGKLQRNALRGLAGATWEHDTVGQLGYSGTQEYSAMQEKYGHQDTQNPPDHVQAPDQLRAFPNGAFSTRLWNGAERFP